MKRAILLFLLLASLAWAQDFPVTTSGLQIGAGPVQIPKSGLPSWLGSEWSPVFNGVNNYALASSAGGPYSTFTVMFWCYQKALASDLSLLYDTEGGTHFSQVKAAMSGSYVQSYFGPPALNSAFPPNVSGWHHVALTKNTSTQTIYIDGVISGSNTSSSTAQILCSDGFYFGRSRFAMIGFFNGSISEFSIWNRELSQSDIQRYKDKRLKGTETGLINLWHMNEGPGVGSQTFIDSVGGKNAIASNAIQWTRRNGYQPPDCRAASMALSFDGVDDVASGPTAGLPATGTARTLSVWVFGSKASGFGYIFGYGKASAGGTNFGIGALAPNKLYVDTYGYNYSVPATFSYAWNHVCVTLPQGGTLSSATIYFNGSPITSARTYNAPEGPNIAMNTDLSADARVSFGDAPQAGNPFQGRVAEGTIWNRALSQSEIQSYMYSTLTGSETGLVRYYKFSEGTGTTIKDYGPGHYDATAYNSPTWTGRDIP